MILHQTIFALFLLSPSLCTGMMTTFENLFPEKDFIDFDTMQDDYLHQDFEKKWHEPISHFLIKEVDNGKSIYKTVSSGYIVAHHSHTNKIEIQDTFNTTIMEEINELRATKESLQQELTEKELFNNKLALQTAQLKEQIISIKKFNAENSSIPYEPIIKIQQQPTKKEAPKTNVNTPKKKAKKKKSIAAVKQKNKPVIQKNITPQNNSGPSESQQRMTAVRSLMKKYNVKNQAQLKDKLHEECKNKDSHGIKGRVDKYCTWGYCTCENELVINTNAHESDDKSDDSSSYDSCYELSID